MSFRKICLYLFSVLYGLTSSWTFAQAADGIPRKVCNFDNRRMVARQGLPGVSPGNTELAYNNAISLGYKLVEVDVGLTSDGVLVAYHGADFSVEGSKPRNLCDVSFDEFLTYEPGKNFLKSQFRFSDKLIEMLAEMDPAFAQRYVNLKPSSLGELFSEFGKKDVVFLLDVKQSVCSGQIAKNLARIVEQKEMVDRVWVESNDSAMLKSLYEINSNLKLIYRITDFSPKKFKQTLITQPQELSGVSILFTPGREKSFKNLDSHLPLFVIGVENPGSIRELCGYVDYFVSSVDSIRFLPADAFSGFNATSKTLKLGRKGVPTPKEFTDAKLTKVKCSRLEIFLPEQYADMAKEVAQACK